MSAEDQKFAPLGNLVREQMPTLKAPDALRARVLEDISRVAIVPAREPAIPRAPRKIRAWLAAAALVIVAGSAYVAGSYWGLPPTSTTERVVLAAHLRSLRDGHLTDVISTDQHTVKPWFAGKLDFSPAVPRLDWRFPLLGGRVDHIGDRPAAVLVYGKDKHIINVFIYPDRGSDVRMRLFSLDGYQTIVWREKEMAYWAVSDVNEEDLKMFQGQFLLAVNFGSRSRSAR